MEARGPYIVVAPVLLNERPFFFFLYGCADLWRDSSKSNLYFYSSFDFELYCKLKCI